MRPCTGAPSLLSTSAETTTSISASTTTAAAAVAAAAAVGSPRRATLVPPRRRRLLAIPRLKAPRRPPRCLSCRRPRSHLQDAGVTTRRRVQPAVHNPNGEDCRGGDDAGEVLPFEEDVGFLVSLDHNSSSSRRWLAARVCSSGDLVRQRDLIDGDKLAAVQDHDKSMLASTLTANRREGNELWSRLTGGPTPSARVTFGVATRGRPAGFTGDFFFFEWEGSPRIIPASAPRSCATGAVVMNGGL
ncbi:unnamed protein product [Ectocarpus sp. 8 AP-2014]